ncbi:MAG: translation initiation factor IF-2 subunit gamma [Candidatus Diapherotrites archaeon]
MSKKESAVQAEVNIGLIGHVDHGKTSLAEALTGKWTDTHSEELKRGISIRLGYADAGFYKCDKCKGAEAYGSNEKCPICGGKGKLQRVVSFVDAPGHETLMATMLSGAALMQGAILVIAANEPVPQPRTAEHLMALSILGVKNVIAVQNKVDLVDRENAMKNYKQIKGFLKEHGYENAPVIPISANFKVNIDLLTEAIQENIPSKERDPKKELLMYVIRSFDVNKPGTKPSEMKGGVLGGSIIEGSLKKGEEIEIAPGPDEKKIVTKSVDLGVSTGTLNEAHSGGLIAVGTMLDPNLTRNDQMRGQIIGRPGKLPAATKNLTLELHPFKRLVSKNPLEIKVNDLIVLAVGATTAVGNIVKKAGEKDYEVLLKNAVVIRKGQKVAVSKRDGTSWRLTAYGVCK